MDRYIEWNWLTQPPLGFPRGEAAERSEADEGRRQVGSQMQLDEWYLLRFLPFNVESSNFLAIATPHQSALPVPKSRHGCQLPPGGSQELRRLWRQPFNEPLYCVGFGVARLATPTGCGGNHWLAATNMVHSLSFAFAQQLPQRGSQGHFVPQTAKKPPCGGFFTSYEMGNDYFPKASTASLNAP